MNQELLRAACASTEKILQNVRPEHRDLPTPCTEWSVHDLTNHVLGTLELGRALLSDDLPSGLAGPGEVPAEDLVGADPLAAYQPRAEAVVAAATPDNVGRVHATPLGDMPGAVLLGFTTVDVFVHGWDLAKATAQDATLDPQLAESVLAFARGTLTDETRAPRIGPEVAVGDDADATARLVAFFGRVP
jgi:uncharacterized protein (TIGR03086 family)